MAQLYAKGKLKLGEAFIHESFIGSKFIGRVASKTSILGQPAIIPSIQGWAKIYGYNTIIIDDEDDPYALGFQVI
jgi:4-hydroxyproline epimerase